MIMIMQVWFSVPRPYYKSFSFFLRYYLFCSQIVQSSCSWLDHSILTEVHEHTELLLQETSELRLNRGLCYL